MPIWRSVPSGSRERNGLAAAQAGDDIIQFDSSLAGGTITLDATLGQLEIDSNVDVQGLGADQLTVDADGNSRVFYVASGVTATLSGLTITGGSSQDEGGGVYISGNTVTITDCTISGNMVASNTNHLYGGGIYSDASELTITNSTISGNVSSVGDADGINIYDTVATIHNTILDDENNGNFQAASSHNLICVIDGSTGLDSGWSVVQRHRCR